MHNGLEPRSHASLAALRSHGGGLALGAAKCCTKCFLERVELGVHWFPSGLGLAFDVCSGLGLDASGLGADLAIDQTT